MAERTDKEMWIEERACIMCEHEEDMNYLTALSAARWLAKLHYKGPE